MLRISKIRLIELSILYQYTIYPEIFEIELKYSSKSKELVKDY